MPEVHALQTFGSRSERKNSLQEQPYGLLVPPRQNKIPASTLANKRSAPTLQSCSVAEPKLFIFGSDSGSTFVHNFGPDFGSSSSSCHILTLKTVLLKQYLVLHIRNMSQWRFFFILASSKLTIGKMIFSASAPAPAPGLK